MTQKELKAVLIAELDKAWHDEKMVKFCTKKAAYIVEHDGKIYTIDKPTIRKDFCFGYGMFAQSTDEEEESADNAAKIAKESENYFISENLKNINRKIEQLEKIRLEMGYNWAEGSHPVLMVEVGAKYSGQSEDCKLNGFSILHTFNGTVCNGWHLVNDTALIDKLIDAYKGTRKDFEKRLNAYLKKYGLSKVNSWSYLVD